MVSPTEVATSQEPLSDEEVVTRVLAGETGMFWSISGEIEPFLMAMPLLATAKDLAH